MLWRCPVCNCQTEEPTCARCQTAMNDGEPSAATGLLKETFGSVVFLIAVICFTAAVVFTIVASCFPAEPIGVKDIMNAVDGFSNVAGTGMSPHPAKAIYTLYTVLNDEITEESGFVIPPVSVLALVGLWLLLAQGYTDRVNLRKGGPVLVKIAVIFGLVGSIVAAVCGVLFCAGLWFGRPELVAALSEAEGDALMDALKVLLTCETTMWLLLSVCCAMFLFGLLYMLFFIFALKTVNGMLYTAKTGDFGKRASMFVGIALCVTAAAMLLDAGASAMTLDWRGIGSVLYGTAYLLFAIVLFRYRYRAHVLLWEQPAFTGETAASMPGIPVGIKVSDLMSEQPTVPVAPSTPATATPYRGIRRTLNEPFAEESLEPKPMTGNGCCPKCGTPIPDNAFFCLNCGNKLK